MQIYDRESDYPIKQALQNPNFNSLDFYGRHKLIVEATYEAFEKLVINYPIEISMDISEDPNTAIYQMNDVRRWLGSHFNPNVYVAFPDWITYGKYMNRWSSVFFKEPQHAMLFKLSWC